MRAAQSLARLGHQLHHVPVGGGQRPDPPAQRQHLGPIPLRSGGLQLLIERRQLRIPLPFTQPADKGAGGGEAVGRGFGQHLHEHYLHRFGQVRPQGARRWHRLVLVRIERGGGVARERHPPGKHLVGHDAQGVPVGGGADPGSPLRVGLLGGHVLRRAQQCPLGGEGRTPLHRLHQAEIHQGGLNTACGLFHDDVAGLDVPVDHIPPVSVVQRLGDLFQDGQHPLQR